MKMTKENFIKILILESSKQNIVISNKTADELYNYKELLIEWNNKINLTTIIDIGTGAGLPGVVVAIYFEGKVKVTLLDSSNKKTEYLKDVVNKLNLKNIYVLKARAEEACNKKIYREQYDVAIARALAKANVLCELLSGYIKNNGICILMKSGQVEEEIKEASGAFKETSLIVEKEDKHEINYLKENLSRTIIIARKKGRLDEKYPRNFGRIKNKPL